MVDVFDEAAGSVPKSWLEALLELSDDDDEGDDESMQGLYQPDEGEEGDEEEGEAAGGDGPDAVARRTRRHLSLVDKDIFELEQSLQGVDPDLFDLTPGGLPGNEYAAPGAPESVYVDFLNSVLQPLSRSSGGGVGGAPADGSHGFQGQTSALPAIDSVSPLGNPVRDSFSGSGEQPVASAAAAGMRIAPNDDEDADDEDYVDSAGVSTPNPVFASAFSVREKRSGLGSPRHAPRAAKAWANFAVLVDAAAGAVRPAETGMTPLMLLELGCLVRGVVQILLQGLLLGASVGAPWCGSEKLRAHAARCADELFSLARSQREAELASIDKLAVPEVSSLDLIGALIALTRSPGTNAVSALRACASSSAFEVRWLCRDSLEALRFDSAFSHQPACESADTDVARPFTKAEDALLALGLERCGRSPDWDEIAAKYLPTRTGAELRARRLSEAVPRFSAPSVFVRTTLEPDGFDREVLSSSNDES
jgi:Myb-like DNA-binding domain